VRWGYFRGGGRRVRVFLRALLSVVLVTGLVIWVGPGTLVEAVADAHIGWLFAALALTTINIVAGALNIFILSKVLAPELRLGNVMRAYLTSWAYGTMTPGRFGDFVLSPLLAKTGVGHGLGLAVVTVDKLVSFAVMAAIVCVGLVAYAEAGQAFIAGFFAVLIIVVVILVIRFPALRMLVRRWILRGQESKFEGFSKQVLSFAREHRGALAINVVWTVIRSLLQACMVGTGLLAFGVSVDIMTILFVNTLAALSAIVPITISGIGLRQGAAVALFEYFADVSPAPVLSAYLLFQVLQYVYAGIFISWIKVSSESEAAPSQW